MSLNNVSTTLGLKRGRQSYAHSMLTPYTSDHHYLWKTRGKGKGRKGRGERLREWGRANEKRKRKRKMIKGKSKRGK